MFPPDRVEEEAVLLNRIRHGETVQHSKRLVAGRMARSSAYLRRFRQSGMRMARLSVHRRYCAIWPVATSATSAYRSYRRNLPTFNA
jgi:hypothetical protein